MLLALPLLGGASPAAGARPADAADPARRVRSPRWPCCRSSICTRWSTGAARFRSVRTGCRLGSVEFLRQANASGEVLNHPNDGGYLEWAVYPRQQIFVDLQTPFLFPDAAIFEADQAFQDPDVLAGLIAAYRPAFLLAPKALGGAMSAWIGRFPDYAPVFVDDTTILLASATAQPELVAKYRLTSDRPVHAPRPARRRSRASARERSRRARAAERDLPGRAGARASSRARSRSSAATPTPRCASPTRGSRASPRAPRRTGCAPTRCSRARSLRRPLLPTRPRSRGSTPRLRTTRSST